METEEQYWGISLDDFTDKIWQIRSDAKGRHYITFAGTRDQALKQITEEFNKLLDKEIYRATPYGYPYRVGDEE